MKANKFTLSLFGRVLESVLIRDDQMSDPEVASKVHLFEGALTKKHGPATASKEEVEVVVQLGVFGTDSDAAGMTHSGVFASIEGARKEMAAFMKEVEEDGTVETWERDGDHAEGFKDGKVTFRIALWTEEVYA